MGGRPQYTAPSPERPIAANFSRHPPRMSGCRPYELLQAHGDGQQFRVALLERIDTVPDAIGGTQDPGSSRDCPPRSLGPLRSFLHRGPPVGFRAFLTRSASTHQRHRNRDCTDDLGGTSSKTISPLIRLTLVNLQVIPRLTVLFGVPPCTPKLSLLFPQHYYSPKSPHLTLNSPLTPKSPNPLPKPLKHSFFAQNCHRFKQRRCHRFAENGYAENRKCGTNF